MSETEDAHPLDRPAWSALTSRQAAIAMGDERALRMSPPYGPFAGARSRADLAALAALDTGEPGLFLIEPEQVEPPSGLTLVSTAPCVQMTATEVPEVEADFEVLTLGEDDAAEMLALATLTRPGPFSTATHRLGAFIGVRSAGGLVAMAGERMKPDGFTEVSGVCVHPDHRGKGYARVLSGIVARRVLARGETPFLHSYATNAGAIALYESLGFGARRMVVLTVLRSAAA